MRELFEKIASRSAQVGVVGQGYVGLPLALAFCESGFHVTGFDRDAAKIESTTYPGTTTDEVRPILEESGLACSTEFLLAFSPEREDPGRGDFTTRTIPKVVGGVDPTSTEAAAMLYAAAVDRVVPVSSADVAESCKLLENVFRSVNIALVNELKVVFDRMGIDVWEVIEAARTKPFGLMPFFPRTRVTRKHDLVLESIPLSPEAFAQFDAVVLSTAHDAFKDPALYADVGLVVDTRNLVARLGRSGARRPRVVKA